MNLTHHTRIKTPQLPPRIKPKCATRKQSRAAARITHLTLILCAFSFSSVPPGNVLALKIKTKNESPGIKIRSPRESVGSVVVLEFFVINFERGINQLARLKQPSTMAKIEGAGVTWVEDGVGAFFEIVSYARSQRKDRCSEGGASIRETWIMSNQRIAFSSLPSTALRVPLSGRTVVLGGRLRILKSMCRMSEKRLDWL